ncbi:lipopolysaccharide biosynthesis protein [Acinetobacter baumannii]|uniref:lipopolysaccharide biosynthesis protein n=1 Tax=Acinetobacter baumannii TaxID=470 RepID=UPI0029579A76|nr:oligosaccharide flippase family protein [Acinetobacter baumannii]
MNIKKILHFSIGPIGAALLGILTIPVLAWLFSIEDIGRFSILQIILSFSCILFTLGLDQAYVREYHETDNHGELFKTVIIPSIILVLICIFFFLFNIKLIAQYAYHFPSSLLSWMTIICVILTILLRYISLTIRMQEKGLLYSVSQFSPKLILLLAILYLYFFDQSGFDFKKLIIIQSFSLFFVFLIFIFFIKEEILQLFHAKFNLSLLKIMLSFGLPLVIGGLVFWLMQSSSRILLLKFSTLKEVGIFGVATSVAAGFSVLTSIFNTIWAPTVFKLIKQGRGKDEVEKVSEYISLLISIIVIFISFLMPVIPKFLPNNYLGIEYVVLLCVMQPLFYTLSEATAVGILINRKTKYSVLISILGLMVNLILLLILVPSYGSLGAAISISVSFWLYFIFRTEFSKIVWESINSKKIYLSTFLCLIFTLGVGVMHLNYIYTVIGAFLLLILNIAIFLNIFKMSFRSLINIFKYR